MACLLFLASAYHVPAGAARPSWDQQYRDVRFSAGSAQQFRREYALALGRIFPPDARRREPVHLRLVLQDRCGQYAAEIAPDPRRPLAQRWLQPRFLDAAAAAAVWRDARATADLHAWIDRQISALAGSARE